MNRPSKAKTARVKNLQEAKARQKPSVEDITATEDPDFEQNTIQNPEQCFFILEDLGSDMDEDESDNEEETGNVRTETDIFMFSQILAQVQLAAVKAEWEAAQGQPNRKRHYTGNAPQTKCYHAQK
ncbi:hypothetical protein BU17DRAFT_72022 [Hysterangium stoloniferum]|nr:hypothetical protein BU17DRAFT_72022 [Hysterangium stoloniferum]